ncbi:unnamed protein product [Nippostrongylus brasiliensis]|uniref:GRIP domain-containing protein n=1 Tax=Nippostrongylus brasiliensis TaxID=27835 RepID=A0A0N4XXT1_NIPBR|nr:unnamed protein product [Nippostrongylus brasiliensis]
MKKKERIHELEASEKLLSRERDELESTLKSTTHQLDQIRQQSESQQQRLEKYKSSSDVWEAKKVELSEQLKAKSRTLLQTERQLRDIRDEFSVVQEVNRTLEIENDSLKKILEETKQNAEVEREQYENSVCDLRRRCESEAAENISLYTCELGKNAALQRDIREKSEEIEALHKQYDSMKKHMESTIEDQKKIYQEKLDKATKRIAEVEGELMKQEEKHKCLEATVQQLEGAHLTETNRRESKIRATRTRVTELESRLVECDRIVLEQRKRLVSLTAEKDEFESKVSNLKTTLLDKESQLCDVNSSVDQLKRSLRSTEQDYREAIRTAENLRRHVSQLQLYADQKDSEIVSMQQRIDELTSLTELHSNLDAELEKLRSDLEEQLNKNEELELIFKEKLEQLEMKNAKHAEKITQLESCIETAKRAASESEVTEEVKGSPVATNRRRKPVVIKPLPTVLLNKDGSDLKIAMDQSSPAKLLIRNEGNLAEQGSTKSSRSNTLDQKTSAIKTASNISHSEKENTVKYGSTRGRRRSGVKLLERASSYVKKRLSISESGFVNRNQ